jgi:hypothetical protein
MNYHKKISFLKSTIRIIGYLLIPFSLLFAVITLVVSELLGYLEEMKE